MLYRELLKRGVSEYLVAPSPRCSSWKPSPTSTTIPTPIPSAMSIAFVGAKGGVGSSTICHNAAWALSEVLKAERRHRRSRSRLRHHRPRFQSGPGAGHRRRAASPERLDEVLLDRLLTKCSEHLSIFAAPVVLDRDYDISAEACDHGHRRRAPERALRGRRPAAHLDRLDQAHPAAGRRGRHHGGARSRQSAQRQEHRRSAAAVARATTASRASS